MDWPEALDLSPVDTQVIAREYLRLFRTETVPRLGRDAETMGRILFSLARNLGQAASYKTLAADMQDATGELDTAAEATIRSYLSILRDSYLMDELPGWVPAARSSKRVATKPKRHLADPSLAVATLALAPASPHGGLADVWPRVREHGYP